MPSACVQAVDNDPVIGDTIFTAPLNKICRITGIQIAEVGGAAGVVTITDTFTPSVSNGIAAPVETVVVKKVMNVAANTTYSWTDETKSIKILGICRAFNNGADDKDVTVMWE